MQLRDLQCKGYEITTDGNIIEIYRDGNLTAAIFERKIVADNNLMNQGYMYLWEVLGSTD